MFDATHPLPADGLAGFGNVDASPSPRAYIEFLDGFQRSFSTMIESAVDLLGLKPGDTVLDAGCGAGAAFDRLARRVGLDGRIVGVDTSRALLDAARLRGADGGPSIELHAADVQALPLPDAAVHAARADRVLIFLERPATALAELVRVTRPGGRIVVTESDRRTQIVDASNGQTSNAVLRAATRALPSGDIGGRLHGLFVAAGLHDVRVEPHGSVVTDISAWWARMGIDAAAGDAVARGVISSEAVAAWRRDLHARAEQGRFFAAGLFFVVSGMRI